VFYDITFTTLLFLICAAFCAGLIDSMAGGGGLIQLPALLIGLPKFETVEVLGTNKLTSVFGTTAATILYRKAITFNGKLLFAMALPAFLGSIGGALLASSIPTKALRPIIVLLLIAVVIYTIKRPQLGAVESLKYAPRKQMRIGALAAAAIGFYDGLIGPGTGSFLILILVAVLGFAFLNATAMAKVINLCTNLGAILVFGLHGSILWKVGFLLAIANIAGGLIGATLAIRGGSAFVRKVFLVITTVLIFKVSLDTITMW
jgi:uncharacterized membrane protein YfcA